MLVLICAVGTIGDVHPLLAIAVAMRERGHRVKVLVNGAFESHVREAGVDFVEIGTTDEIEQLYRDPRSWSYADGWKLWIQQNGLRHLRRLYSTIRELYEPGETVLVSSFQAFGARVAEEHLNIPLATLHLDPHTLRTLHDVPPMPPPMMTASWVPRWLVRMQFALADRFWVDPQIGPELNSFRAELQLPAASRIAAGWWNSPRRIIGLFPDWLASKQPDWPDQVELTGFPIWDRSGSMSVPAHVEEFLQSGPPSVLFAPGAGGLHTRRIYATVIEACRRIGRRCLMVTKRADLLPNPLPPDFCRAEYLPFSQVLPRVAVAVHHAGMGTIAQCLASAVPQLVLPTQFNQPDNARRLERLGVGRTLSPQRITVQKLAVQLNELLDSSEVAVNCRQFADRLQKDDPMPRLCELLETLSRGGPQQSSSSGQDAPWPIPNAA